MESDPKKILDMLGIKELGQGLVQGTPPIEPDREKLAYYFRNELPEIESELIEFLLSNYQAWDEVGNEVLLQMGIEAERRKEIVDEAEEQSNLVREFSANRKDWAMTIAKYFRTLLSRRAIVVALPTIALIYFGVTIFYGDSQEGFFDGEILLVKRDGIYDGIANMPNEVQELAKNSLESKSIGVQLANELNSLLPSTKGSELPKSKAILYPYLESVKSDRPVLRWARLPDAKGVRVEVYGTEDDSKPFDAANLKDETEWQLSERLTRGGVYYWKITYTMDTDQYEAPRNNKDAKALFRILSAADLRVIQVQEQAYEDRKFTLALLYAQHGLLEECERSLVELLQANQDSEDVQLMLESIKGLRGSK